ncbi:hypothetical protein GCM10018777_22200 [Streptomyces albogriseolus]|nr:hypothetical protein GCM10018777_22200 [Streptomyces viridodiastaticus]
MRLADGLSDEGELFRGRALRVPGGSSVLAAHPCIVPNATDNTAARRGTRKACPQRTEARCPPERERHRASAGNSPRRYSPAAFFSASTRSVRSQVKSGSSRPKWPYAAVWA